MSIQRTILSASVAAFLSLSIFVFPLAAAAEISGEASISGQFVPKTTFTDNSSPVAISETRTVLGTLTGTVLGQVKVNGTDGGFFSLGSFGQKAFDHESKFSFSDVIMNTGSSAAQFTMDLLISAGALETIAREIPPRSGSDANLQAGYEIVISAGSSTLFTSAATLSMTGDYPDSFDTNAILNKSGTDLGGVLSNPATGAPDSWLYAWDDFMGSADLGVLAAGESVMISYVARTFVIAGVDKCSTSDCAAYASIGDPFGVYGDILNDAQSSIGGANTISSAPVAAIPEPEIYAMFGLGLGLLGWVGRRRRLQAA